MKNLALLRLPKRMLGNIMLLCLLFTSGHLCAQEVYYKIESPKVSIACSGKFKDWSPVISSYDLSGIFIADQGKLARISDFRINLSVLSNATIDTSNFLENAMQSHANNRISFNQKQVMILPIMKQVHLVGNLNLLDKEYASPMFLVYHVEEDQSITVKGKQMLWVKDLVVTNRELETYTFKDEISIDIEFKLVKKENTLAVNTLVSPNK